MSGAAGTKARGGKTRSLIKKKHNVFFNRCVGCTKAKCINKLGICHFTSGHSHVHDNQKGLSHSNLKLQSLTIIIVVAWELYIT